MTDTATLNTQNQDTERETLRERGRGVEGRPAEREAWGARGQTGRRGHPAVGTRTAGDKTSARPVQPASVY